MQPYSALLRPENIHGNPTLTDLNPYYTAEYSQTKGQTGNIRSTGHKTAESISAGTLTNQKAAQKIHLTQCGLALDPQPPREQSTITVQSA